jgi:hypothetical protein
VFNYFGQKKFELNIKEVIVSYDPNGILPDIKIIYNDSISEEIEVKSIKNTSLASLTICNRPELITKRKTFLIQYSAYKGKIIITKVYETELFRLTTLNTTGKYTGCIKCIRDTGKKIKGRNFSEFINTSDDDDLTYEEITNPSTIRKTVLLHSVSKLIDPNYNFTNEEIDGALKFLRST